MRVIRRNEFQRMPWKNGGGETVQVAIDEQARGLEDFSWRVSMAHVGVDGPFSIFPGIDRTLCILDGAGMALRIAGRSPVMLRPDSPPFFFPADVPVAASLPGGPVTDLNVMTARGRARHFVSRMTASAPQALRLAGDVMLLMPMGAGCSFAGETLTAGDGDCVLFTGAERLVTPAPAAHCTLYVIDIWLA